jgi:DNA helicase II / ATP-dependent DNA helicase PcrA
LVELVASLINDRSASAPEILCLTFTRAAAAGLRSKIARGIGEEAAPDVYTLHGYALRQLMARNIDIGAGRGRDRVADDWEERQIVEEDLKVLLGETKIKAVRTRLANLASAWESSPDPGVEETHPDSELVGALRRHKSHYRYILRSELVYRLKEQFDANPYLELTGTYKYVVVDEYQDLNRCDVAVVDAIAAAQGAHLFVAGDDDQSIYQQLRNAHPQAIRDFVGSHDAADLRLVTCIRCDRGIIGLAHQVISQEVGRTDKDHEPHASAGPGIVEAIAFRNGEYEAKGIAKLAKKFIDAGVAAHEVMVLLRSDRYGRFSDPIEREMAALRVPAKVRTDAESALDTSDGRALLAHLRLIIDASDDLAWRTVFMTGHLGVGGEALKALHALATGTAGMSLAAAVHAVQANPTLITATFGPAVSRAAGVVQARVADIIAEAPLATSTVDEVIDVAQAQLPPSDDLTTAVGELKTLSGLWNPTSLSDFLSGLALRKEEEEDLARNTVNIMTAHRAKGLDACIVILACAEEELFPGIGAIDEERRLFYVSLTRAKHALFITHANARSGIQRHSGTGDATHQRTKFLDGTGLVSRTGNQWIDGYTPDIRLLSPITSATDA